MSEINVATIPFSSQRFSDTFHLSKRLVARLTLVLTESAESRPAKLDKALLPCDAIAACLVDLITKALGEPPNAIARSRRPRRIDRPRWQLRNGNPTMNALLGTIEEIRAAARVARSASEKLPGTLASDTAPLVEVRT